MLCLYASKACLSANPHHQPWNLTPQMPAPQSCSSPRGRRGRGCGANRLGHPSHPTRLVSRQSSFITPHQKRKEIWGGMPRPPAIHTPDPTFHRCCLRFFFIIYTGRRHTGSRGSGLTVRHIYTGPTPLDRGSGPGAGGVSK